MSVRIAHIHRVVQAIGKQVCAQNRSEIYHPIRIDKPPHFRIIIPAVEVVQSRFGVIIVSAVTERVDCTESIGMASGNRKDLSIRPICVFDNFISRFIQQRKHIAVLITQIKRLCIAVGHAVGVAVRVIIKVDRLTYTGLLKKHLRAVHHISGRSAVYRFPCADPVGVALCVCPRRDDSTRAYTQFNLNI